MQKHFYFYLLLLLPFSLSLAEGDLPVCQAKNCPPSHGTCLDSKCVCSTGYVTAYLDQSEPFKYCNYAQISRWIPFILEFLVPTAGNFYVGNTLRGFIKLIFLVGPFIIWGFGYILKNACYKDSDEIIGTVTLISFFVFIGFFIFQIVDLILYGIAYIPDGNGIALM